MKKYSCPDCIIVDNEKFNPCEFCKKINQQQTNPIWDWQKINPYWSDTNYESDPCDSCPNNPHNGGSGICHCTIPYMHGKNKIRRSVSD